MAFVMAIGSVVVAACERPLDFPNPYGYDSKIYVFMFVFSFYTMCFFLSLLQTASRVLPPVTSRSRVRVAVSPHCTGEGKACH